MMPDGHEVVPLFRELPDKGLEDVGNTLAIFFDCAIGGHVAWGTVGSYAGFLVIALAVTAVAATRAFRTYQRSA